MPATTGPHLATDNVILPPTPSTSKLGLLLFHIVGGHHTLVMMERSTLPNATEYKLPQVDLIDPVDPDEPQYMGNLGRQALVRLFGLNPLELEYWNSLRKPVRNNFSELEMRRKRFDKPYTETFGLAFKYNGIIEKPATEIKNGWWDANMVNDLTHPYRHASNTIVLGMLPDLKSLAPRH